MSLLQKSHNMKLVTWNINSVRARLDNVTAFLEKNKPDIVCLQEIKCQDGQFPQEIFEDLGYNGAVFGQKSYNGVAILSKYPLSDVVRGLPDFDDDSARYIAADICIGDRVCHIINGYMPNGNPIATPKYDYKLAWLRGLVSHIKTLRETETPFILCGDFNIIPNKMDVRHPEKWSDDALFQTEIRALYHELLFMGLTDSVRSLHPNAPSYSFWDYQARSWEKNNGIRIDHILTSPELSDNIDKAYIESDERDHPKASDHAPVIAEFLIKGH